jgi:hypothetical protein
MKFRLGALLVAAVAASTPAQQLAVTVSPNPAPLGSTITVTANSVGAQVWTPFGCLITAVRQGSPTGPVVRNFACTFLSVAIPPCGSAAAPRTGTWNQTVTGGGIASPGLYYFEIQHVPAMFGSPTTSEFFAVRIDGPTPDPILSAAAPPTWNSFFPMTINAPLYPNDFYLVALSATTNTGIPIGPGQLLSLDNDVLFSLSFPAPLPIFQGFQSFLDPAGQSTGLGIQFPPNPGLLCFPFHAQGAVFPIGGGIALTNEISLILT